MKFRMLTLAAVLALSATVADARNRKMDEPPRVSIVHQDGKAATQAEVRAAIVHAAEGYKWRVTKDEPGKLVLQYNRAQHEVVIRVDYDAAGFQIFFVSSRGMDFEMKEGEKYIHPKYNDWIENLSKSVRVD